MIPILYKSTETDFSHNGIGHLTETISCIVTEHRNGSFEAELTYPSDGVLYPEIKEGCFFKAKPNDVSDPQLFRIYKSSKPLNKKVTFFAEHISYLLCGIPIEKVEINNADGQTALSAVLDSGIFPHNFVGYSDIKKTHSAFFAFNSIRSALGGTENSLLDTYGGEFEFDNFAVKLLENRGSDTGIQISYGKNLTDIKQDCNTSEVFNSVFPFATYIPESTNKNTEPNEIIITLPEKVIYSQNDKSQIIKRVYIKDFSDLFEKDEKITVEKLRQKAQYWVDTSGFDIPKINITVSFKTLWNSPEYEKYAMLERVSLCDIVTVHFQELSVKAKAKVIKTVYDTLAEKYISIQLGDVKSNFADTLNKTFNSIKHKIEKQNAEMDKTLRDRIQSVLLLNEMISNSLGLYSTNLKLEDDSTIFYMHDHPALEESNTIYTHNANGFAWTNSGWNGGSPEFANGIDKYGNAVLNAISTFKIQANMLEAGCISSKHISAEGLDARDVKITNLNADNITGGTLNVEYINCKEVVTETQAQKEIKTIVAGEVQTSKLSSKIISAAQADIEEIVANKIKATDIIATRLSSASGTFTELTATKGVYKIALKHDYVDCVFDDYVYQRGRFGPLGVQVSKDSSANIVFSCGIDSFGAILSASTSTAKIIGNWTLPASLAVDSDTSLKHDIQDLSDKYDAFFDRLHSVTYKYNNGTSDRFHTGFLASEVESALAFSDLSTKDFAGYVLSHEPDENGNQKKVKRLRYEEFIALNTWQIQKLKTRILNLESLIKESKNDV